MARKYTRDNRGRFASVGATARGGRLKTAGGNKRKSQKISALSGDRMSSVPKGTIGRTRKQRQITMIDRPQAKRPAYNAGRSQQVAAIAARKAPKPVAAKRIKAAAPANTVANKTGQSKTLNKFNSRPKRTRGAYVGGRYVSKEKLSGRQPLDMGYGSDRAYGRVATKAARKRAANSAASTAAKPVAKRSKTDQQVMQQADRLMGKLAKRQASINAGKVGLNEGLRQVRRNNARAGRVNAALNSRGLFEQYIKANAPADPIRMTPAGKGIKAKAAKPAAKNLKVDLSPAAVSRRRSRAMAQRSSVAGGDFNMKLTTRSAITRSAANAIYNRQKQITKGQKGNLNSSIVRDGIGVLPGLSGSKRQRANQLREQARKRVISGRRR